MVSADTPRTHGAYAWDAGKESGIRCGVDNDEYESMWRTAGGDIGIGLDDVWDGTSILMWTDIEEKRNAQFLTYRELCIFVNKYF